MELPRCGLGESHRGDLGVGVGDPGDAQLVDGLGLKSGDVLGDEDALGEAAVRQLQPGHDVPHGIHAVHAGATAPVGRHESAVQAHARLLVSQPVGDRAAAHGHQQQVGLDRLAVLHGDGHDVLVLGRAGEPHAGAHPDLALLEGPLQRPGDRLVLGRHQPRQDLHDGDLGPEGTVHRGELHPDHATAQHDDPPRHLGQADRLVAGHHPATDLQSG